MLFRPEVIPYYWTDDKSDCPIRNYMTLDWLGSASHVDLQQLLCCYSLVVVNGHRVIPDQIVSIRFHCSLLPAHVDY